MMVCCNRWILNQADCLLITTRVLSKEAEPDFFANFRSDRFGSDHNGHGLYECGRSPFRQYPGDGFYGPKRVMVGGN